MDGLSSYLHVCCLRVSPLPNVFSEMLIVSFLAHHEKHWKFVSSLAEAVEVENHLFCSLCLMQNGDSLVSLCECGSLRAKAHYSTNIFTDNIKNKTKHTFPPTRKNENRRLNVFIVNLFSPTLLLGFFHERRSYNSWYFFQFLAGNYTPIISSTLSIDCDRLSSDHEKQPSEKNDSLGWAKNSDRRSHNLFQERSVLMA